MKYLLVRSPEGYIDFEPVPCLFANHTVNGDAGKALKSPYCFSGLRVKETAQGNRRNLVDESRKDTQHVLQDADAVALIAFPYQAGILPLNCVKSLTFGYQFCKIGDTHI